MLVTISREIGMAVDVQSFQTEFPEFSASTHSTVQGIFEGTSETVIAAGSRAETIDGVRFNLDHAVTLSEEENRGSGVAYGNMTAVVIGPQEAKADTLTVIVDAVSGWNSINNAFDARLGRNAISNNMIDMSLENAGYLHKLNEKAQLYCAAHLLSLALEEVEQPDGGFGEVSLEMYGSKQAQYKTMASDNWQSFFTTSKFGRMFLMLEKRLPELAIPIRVF